MNLRFTALLPNCLFQATGTDKMSTNVLQIAAPAKVQHLTKIFNKSIILGQFPSEWKEARVIPLLQKGAAN